MICIFIFGAASQAVHAQEQGETVVVPKGETAPQGEMAPPEEGLPAGTVLVEVRSWQGEPAPGKVVIAAVRDANGKMQERKVTSNGAGESRFDGLPTDNRHQVAFFFIDGGMPLAQTAPMHLPADAGRRLEMRLPLLTDAPSKVEVRTYRAVFSKNHGRVDVALSLSFATPPGVIFRAPSGLRIELPKGAMAPSVPGEEAAEHTRIEAEAVFLLDPVTSQGVDVEIHFELEPIGGRLDYEHRMSRPLPMAQLISTWTEKSATLVGEGMPAAELRQMQSGLLALITMARDLQSGVVRATLDGLDPGSRKSLRLVALLLSAVLFCLGAAVWIRDRSNRAKG
jgi:hypothetical protein